MLGRDQISHMLKMHYFFINLHLYSQQNIRQTKYVVMTIKEGSTKTLHFFDSWGSGSDAKAWPYIFTLVNMYYTLLHQYTLH